MINYKGWTWNADDLISSKFALTGMLKDGIINVEEAFEMESRGLFGNLDVAAVMNDYFD